MYMYIKENTIDAHIHKCYTTCTCTHNQNASTYTSTCTTHNLYIKPFFGDCGGFARSNKSNTRNAVS